VFNGIEMAENPASYQSIYGVSVLDDIHNYFPALLYDQGRFQNITDVFSYVRHTMNTRFNLYSYGASLANISQPTQPQRRPSVPVRTREEEDVLSSIASVNLLLNLINPVRNNSIDFIPASRLSRGGRGQASAADIWAEFRAPVIVAPSREILLSNTQVIPGSDLPSNTVCTVCQDIISPTESCRKLTACNHVYHLICIDQWFSRSVFCPTCRHDIRQAAVTAPSESATPQ